mmetsp:Transcript_3684/g.9354  ORF Transcript_3684/g.9354 Transcript_3684/m.9354 type:complete len:270 (+) Transcript_3684:1112-1921(+)
MGTAGATSLSSGCGLPRQKLLNAHTQFKKRESFPGCTMFWRSGCIAPDDRTMLRNAAESPAIFPRHHAHCSRTSGSEEDKSWVKCGTAPASTIAFVCSVEAMFVRAHAASNCTLGLSLSCSIWTNAGSTPLASTSSTGGSTSTLSIFRKPRTTSRRAASSMLGCCSAVFREGMSATLYTFFDSKVLADMLSFITVDMVGDGAATAIALRLAIPSSFLFLRSEMVVSVRRRRPSMASMPFLKSDLREFSRLIFALEYQLGSLSISIDCFL